MLSEAVIQSGLEGFHWDISAPVKPLHLVYRFLPIMPSHTTAECASNHRPHPLGSICSINSRNAKSKFQKKKKITKKGSFALHGNKKLLINSRTSGKNTDPHYNKDPFFPYGLFSCFTRTYFLSSWSGIPIHTFQSLLILCQICPVGLACMSPPFPISIPSQ